MLNAIVALNATFEIAEQRKGFAIQNLNATIREEDRLTLQETVADECDLSPEQRTIKAEVLRELYSGMNQLPERERCYVLYRYGFLDSEDHSLTETAKHTPATKPRFHWMLPASGEFPLWIPYVRGTLFPLNSLATNPLGFIGFFPTEKKQNENRDAHFAFSLPKGTGPL